MKNVLAAILVLCTPLASFASYDASLADLVVSGDPSEFSDTRALAINTDDVVFRVSVRGCDQIRFDNTQVACMRNGQVIFIGDIVGQSFTVDGELGYDEVAQSVRLKPGITADLKMNTAGKIVSYILTIK